MTWARLTFNANYVKIVIMTTDTKLGQFEDLLLGTTSEVQQILEFLRALVIELHANTVEVPRVGERSVAYGFGVKKMSEAYLYLMPQKDYVNLGFYHGTNLPDPKGLLEGTGKALRHVKIRGLEMAQALEIKTLMLAAMAERQEALKK
jgi:ribosomal protein S6